MAVAAAELYAMLTAYCSAGFSRKEALYLVGKYMAAIVAAQTSGGTDDD